MEPRFEKMSKKQLLEKLEMYELIVDSIYNGIMVTDGEGFVTHFNKPYGHFLGLNPEEQIGKHCTDVIENTRMQIVAKTGKAEINQPHFIKGQKMVVQRIPIRKDGNVIAVFGQVMFKDVRDVGKLAQRLSLLESKVKLYEQELVNLRSTRYTFDSIIGESDAIFQLKQEALQAAQNQFPVLITGQSGTGKELFAQAIHHAGPRRLYPFVRINCSAIPRDLLESELFGYDKGAFTGAHSKGKPGKFELADSGTIFLDEIGDLPLEMQPKLLRVLEEREFERIGGTTLIRPDFRLIAATNQNLDEMMAKRSFRKDLFYRLNVISLDIPPLKERPEDIIPITRHLVSQAATESSLANVAIDRRAQRALTNWHWPGNVRELSNALERALSALESDIISLSDLPFYLQNGISTSVQEKKPVPLREVLYAAEARAIHRALVETGNNKALAAKLLGIHRTLLYKKMKRHGIGLSAGTPQ